MENKYEVIVIGAGLGGLSAATMLARNGRHVLLLERHNIPGGYATSFVRGRYEFEIALHEMSGIGPPGRRGFLYRYLEYLGMADRVEFINMPNLCRAIFPDLDVTLPTGRERFEEKLCTLFPHEATGIRRFLRRVFGLRRDFDTIIEQKGPGNLFTVPFRLPHFFRYMASTWSQVLNRDVQDPRARAVLSQCWGYFGMPPSKVAFLYFGTGLATLVEPGPAFPKGRSQALANAFLAAFEDWGGLARLNCGVRQITTAGGRVTGVITEEDEEIHADWIVSNADPITTCRDLIGRDQVPASFFTQLQSSEVAVSTFNVYLGVARPPETLGLTEHENFIYANYDFDRQYERARHIAPLEAILATCYNAILPEISPPGTSIVTLVGLMFGEPWYAVPPAEYVATKNRIADAMIEMAEGIAPGLHEHTEVVEVATPLTNMRFAGTMGGSVYGFNQWPRDNIVWRMGHQGPLGGLYFVGAWTQPGGGFHPCITSGQVAGARILDEMKTRAT